MSRGRLLAALLGVLLTASLAWAAAQAMSVQVREGQVREQPSFLSAVLATLAYGERVQTLEDKGSWIKVTSSQGASGWMHVSALTEKKIELQAGQGQAATGASKEEMALAGKGFNKDVEADFKAKNKEANFAAVDKMETGFPVAADQMTAFLREGGVVPPEGGGQ